jgi:uncharacterized protein YndB with AHSA1/START domain
MPSEKNIPTPSSSTGTVVVTRRFAAPAERVFDA